MCNDRKVPETDMLRFEGEEVDAAQALPWPLMEEAMKLTPRPMPVEQQKAWMTPSPSELVH